jgi:hypothetical protein
VTCLQIPTILNVHNVSDVRQLEIHTAEPLVPDLSRLEGKTGIAKLKKYKSPGSYQILAELIKAGRKILLSAKHKLVNSIWNNCLISGRSLLLHQIRGVGVRIPIDSRILIHQTSCSTSTGRSLPPWIKRQRLEADHSPRSSAEVKKMWTYTSTPPYVFMAEFLIS